MRAVIQRVRRASCSVGHARIGKIEYGMCVLLGVEREDTLKDLLCLARKIAQLRIFADEQGVMNKNVQEINGEILVISQFTLHADCKKGNRPSYHWAAPAHIAQSYYDNFILELKQLTNLKVERGQFGAEMEIRLVNHGPVTVVLDSKELLKK